MSQVVTICAAQIAPQLGEARSNSSLVESELERAAREGATLTVFPEAALTGYVFESFDEALSCAVSADARPRNSRSTRSSARSNVKAMPCSTPRFSSVPTV